MSEEVKEISFHELGLSKPLEKMTAKELRALCLDKLPMVVGASGMDKDALVAKIKEIFGIVDEEGGVSPYKSKIHAIKAEIRALRTKKGEMENRAQRDRVRRKINQLKKTTRRLARAI